MTILRHTWRRRDAVRIFAATGGLLAAGIWRSTTSIASPTTVAQSTAAAACTLSAEQEEGPFYVDLDLLRSDLREDQVGIPLILNMTVLDSTTCQPLPNAAVDIWSANALGVYSDEAQQPSSGSTFLRGVQVTDANGAVQFTTLYPGWYTGRVNHIHMKVHVGGTASSAAYDESGARVAHTGQLFFPQDVNDQVGQVSPYTTNRNSYTTNTQDRVYTSEGGSGSVLVLAGNPSDGFSGSITLSVDPGATPSGVGGVAPGGGVGRRGPVGPPPAP